MRSKPITINERIMYSTVRIEGRRAGGAASGGTGFFLSHSSAAGAKVQMLVSNRHVVGGLETGTLHLHRPRATTERGQVVPVGSVPLEIDGFEPRWVPHPDPAVGLRALPYEDVHAAIQTAGQDVFATFFETARVIPPDEALASVDAAEEVQLVGYPDGVWDRVNSFPIFRRGTIASHPRIDYRGRPEILIDIVLSPGCSGSPVVVVSRTAFKKEEAELWPVILLGVLSSGLDREAESAGEGGPGSRTEGATGPRDRMHLGALVKARELLVLAEAVAAKAGPPV